MIRVVVIDDHDVVRRGVIAYLDTEEDLDIIGEASSGHEGAALVKEIQPDVVLMDLMMENGDGIEATKEIMKTESCNCKIIILTSYYDDEKVFPALEAGAFSYMLKTSSADQIADAIRKAAMGENVIESKVATKMMTRFQREKLPHEELTNREMEVLLCVGQGMTNQEIGEKLYIGIKTVKTHVSNILSKLDVHDRTQAAVYVHRNQLLNHK
ncbi:response regulator transcription factor [Halobacillus locisalis]|uniref:Response regulator transcription factor n=1 Tax=Halobacillus locisalis TaxID=220753 RepID=A0A838CR04_9BACI|nr:response regulator transcription factor [Halobacillus locisalis]MBA2174552.1 response regulator transcription factor [Halobacillus locisalis]